MYAGGASGGVWKTTNFLDSNGPTWEPLTSISQGQGIYIGGIAVFGRNNDPSQSIIFAGTGEGNVTAGAGVLRSMDGGKTWVVLDSTVNVDAANNVLGIGSALRDHKLAGNQTFRIIVDPTPLSNGDVIVYLAMGNGGNAGVWRSIDSGGHWTLLQAGNATDVVLAPASAAPTGLCRSCTRPSRGRASSIRLPRPPRGA